MKKCGLAFIFCFLLAHCFGQNIERVGTIWGDEFTEWFFLSDSLEGEIKMRWQMNDDWTEWDYHLDHEIHGSIEMKWRDDPTLWEVRGEDEIITCRIAWPNDFTEWRISNGDQTVTLRSKYTNQLDEWEVKSLEFGNFFMYTTFEGDTREWAIEDYTENLSFEMKMAITFIAILHSIPR